MQTLHERAKATRFPSLAESPLAVEHGEDNATLQRQEQSGLRRWLRKTPVELQSPLVPKLVAPQLVAPQLVGSSDLGAQAEPLPLLPGTVVAGRYQVLGLVGSGNFAAVYRARDRQMSDHEVALKLQHAEAASTQSKTAALRELHTLASVVHPAVVPYKDHGWFEGRLWFVMPLYEGETLEQRLRRQPLAREEARRIFEPLAAALATVHEVGIRHQDIKPDNIFLVRAASQTGAEEGSFAVLLDFGVAVRGDDRLVAGTPEYFAPEIASRFLDTNIGSVADEKADVFSLALCLRNALEPSTRQRLRDASRVMPFVQQRAEQPPPLLQEKSLRDLNPWLQRWLHVDASRRPSAAELASQLRVLTQPQERRQRRRETLRWALPLMLGTAALFALVALALRQQVQRQASLAHRARHAEAGVRGTLQAAHQREQRLQGELSALRQNLQEEQARLRALQSGLQALETQTQEAQQNLLASQQRRRDLAGELSQAEEQLAQSRLQLEASQAAIQQEKKTRQRLEQKSAAALAESAAQLASQKRQLQQLQLEAGEAKQALAVARREKEALETERQDLEADLVDTLNRLERLKRREPAKAPRAELADDSSL